MSDAQPGDVLFYLNDSEPDWPYHSMVLTQLLVPRRGGEPDAWVVYHTGPDQGKPGVVKKVRLSDLALHPVQRWHPVVSNPYFLGVYRWKFLE